MSPSVTVPAVGTADHAYVEADTRPHDFPRALDCELAARLLHKGTWEDSSPIARDQLAARKGMSGTSSIAVSPGGISLITRQRPLGRELREPAPAAFNPLQLQLDDLADEHGSIHGPPIPEPVTVTRWWSARSRSRMIRALASVDWEPVMLTPRTRPAMITLTYPGDWLTAAPDAATAKDHLVRFRKRLGRLYEREGLGAPAGVWKLEFQARGAPHFHIYAPVPVGRLSTGHRFVDWLSVAWADIVNHPDPEQRARHRAAGTGLDFAEGSRCSDPKRLAVYFTRHNAKGGRGKEYQHRVPDAWTDAGRWWGTWGVKRIAVEANLTTDELVEVKRLLRRWIRSQGRISDRKVRRGVSPGGVVRSRWVSRRYEVRSMAQSQGGFVIANDGPALAAMISRHLEAHRAARADN